MDFNQILYNDKHYQMLCGGGRVVRKRIQQIQDDRATAILKKKSKNRHISATTFGTMTPSDLLNTTRSQTSNF